MGWAKNKTTHAAKAAEYDRVKKVVEEILAEKYASPMHLLPRNAQEVYNEES